MNDPVVAAEAARISREWAANLRAVLLFLVAWTLALAAFIPPVPLAIVAAVVVGGLALLRARCLTVAERMDGIAEAGS